MFSRLGYTYSMNEQTRNSIKGSARKEFFKRGGTPDMWRGSAKRFTDRRKEQDKNACRNADNSDNE